MKTSNIYKILLAIAVITNFSCNKFDNCIKGDGNYITETRIVSGSFSGIEMDGSFNVFVTKDTVTYIEVEADSNLMPFIITRVRSNRLLLDNEEKCLKSRRSINVYVSMPFINQVLHDGSGIIEVDTIDADEAEIELNGSGEIYVDWIYTEFSDVSLDGSGRIIMDVVTSPIFDIHHDGSGSILIEDILANSIDVNLDGSGNIEIYRIDAHHVSAGIKGSGYIKMEGYANNSDLKITGSGNIKAQRLYLDECDAYISGSGTIYVFVYDELTIDIPGSGMVFYDGNPKIYLIGYTDFDQVRRI